MWSILWDKSRVTFQGNAATKRFKQRRFFIIPPGEPLPKLRKTLAHRKLGVVVVPENRAIIWTERRKFRISKNNRTLAHKELWSRSWLKNRVTSQKNAAIKNFNQKIRWFTILPPGGGEYKPREFTIFKTKNDKILLPIIPVKRKWDTRGVEILLDWDKSEDTLVEKGNVINLSRDVTAGSYWSTSEDTLAPGGHVITLSSDGTTGSYCSILEESRMEDWDKYTLRCRCQQSQSSEFIEVTPLQSVIESRNLKSTCKGKPNHKYKSKFKNFKKRQKYLKLQISKFKNLKNARSIQNFKFPTHH